MLDTQQLDRIKFAFETLICVCACERLFFHKVPACMFIYPYMFLLAHKYVWFFTIFRFLQLFTE